MPTSEGPKAAGFWRCLKCGTPNPSTLYLSTCIACGHPRPAPGFESAIDEGPRTRATDGPTRKVRSIALLVAVVTYGLILAAAFLLQSAIGDDWWPGMVLYLSPRSVFLIPLMGLALWTLRARKRWIGLAIGVEALFVAGPLMGFNVPWSRLTSSPGGPSVRIMTYNRGGRRIEEEALLRYLERHKVDVVCFQEMGPAPTVDRVLAERGWHRDTTGSIASRFPIVEEYPVAAEVNEVNFLYTALLRRVRVRGPGDREFVVGCLHMPTARYALGKLRQFDSSDLGPFIRWWRSEFARMFRLVSDFGDLPVLVGGDFNNGPDAASLTTLRDTGQFRSAFGDAGWGWAYTRPAGFSWARIDHILASSPCTTTCAWVGPSFGSDHKSLVAEVALPARP